MQWKENLTLDSKYTVQQVIEYAINTPSFYTALLSVAATQTGRMVSNIVLGRWLKRVQGKIVNGFVLLQDGSMGGYPLWKLTPR
jgi:hypothetical protein